MRDQYAGDVSDVIKFALLRALAAADRKLGIAWYYNPGDDGKSDGRHLEWRDEEAWSALDADLHRGLSTLPERSVAALEKAAIWPSGILFHREPVPSRFARPAWAAQKREILERADIVFLDPDNGMGRETLKHATFLELRYLRKPGRALVFITFPGRSMPHDALVQKLHERVEAETEATRLITLRTNVSVPQAPGSARVVQRQRWFTIIEPDDLLIERLQTFANRLAAVPRIKTKLTHYSR